MSLDFTPTRLTMPIFGPIPNRNDQPGRSDEDPADVMKREYLSSGTGE